MLYTERRWRHRAGAWWRAGPFLWAVLSRGQQLPRHPRDGCAVGPQRGEASPGGWGAIGSGARPGKQRGSLRPLLQPLSRARPLQQALQWPRSSGSRETMRTIEGSKPSPITAVSTHTHKHAHLHMHVYIHAHAHTCVLTHAHTRV